MILVDGEKYACVQCIRGHRSSTCKHSARPLVQVRSRGRPSLNAGHRIAVTESELVLSRDEVTIQDSVDTKQKKPIKAPEPKAEPEKPTVKSSCCSQKKEPTPPVKPVTKSCCGGGDKSTTPSAPQTTDTKVSCCLTTHSECGCGKNGVIMLRASKRQFVDVRNGSIDYVGPYNETSTNKFKIGLSNPNKRSKHTRNSSCCSAASESASTKLKILKTIKMNEFDYQIPKHLQYQQPTNNHIFPSQQYSKDHMAIGFPLATPPVNYPQQPQSQQSYPSNSNFDQAFQEYQRQSTPPTSISSGDHYNGHQPQPQLHPQQQFQPQHMAHPLNQQPQEKLYDVVYSSGCASECNCGPDCTCPGCLIHRTNEELKEYGILDTSSSSTPSEVGMAKSQSQQQQQGTSPVNYDLINLETIDEMLLRDMFEEECYCKPEECCCYNCSKHGISEGIRLSDGVRVAEPDGELDFGREVTPVSQL